MGDTGADILRAERRPLQHNIEKENWDSKACWTVSLHIVTGIRTNPL